MRMPPENTPMHSSIIETSRLLLRHWLPTDTEPFTRMNADADVMRYYPEPYTKERTQALVASIQQELQQYGFGLYAAQEKESGQFMGYIGLHRATFAASFCPCVEIGWRLDKAFWNKGFATEGAKACLAHAFQHLGLHTVYSFTAMLNAPSQRVMQKIGMRFVQHFQHPELTEGHPLCPHVLYGAHAEAQE